MVSLSHNESLPIVPNVVIVDPQFQAYGPLVTAARAGRLNVHLRASGAEALKLARRLEVDAWLIASDLDDMSGADFAALLAGALPSRVSRSVAFVESAGSMMSQTTAGARTLEHPISLAAVEEILRTPDQPAPDVSSDATSIPRTILSLPVGVGATLLALAALMIG